MTTSHIRSTFTDPQISQRVGGRERHALINEDTSGITTNMSGGGLCQGGNTGIVCCTLILRGMPELRTTTGCNVLLYGFVKISMFMSVHEWPVVCVVGTLLAAPPQQAGIDTVQAAVWES